MQNYISFGLCIPRSHSWYHWKALRKEECMEFVLWCLELQCESYKFLDLKLF